MSGSENNLSHSLEKNLKPRESQYGCGHGKKAVHAYLGLLVESYSCTVPNILVPTDVRGQRSHTGGLEWGREGSSHSEDMFGLAQQDLNFF